MSTMNRPVVVLCARRDSIYHTLPGLTVYDEERDARTHMTGAVPVVAHPPCRSWGKLRAFSKHQPGERNLAALCVNWVRLAGGVLEHPAGSTLFKAAGMPVPGSPPDAWSGYTIEVPQFLWGHPCEKRTWLYIKGVALSGLPVRPTRSGEPTHVIDTRLRPGDAGFKPRCTKKWREATPPAFAEWLVEVARRTTTW